MRKNHSSHRHQTESAYAGGKIIDSPLGAATRPDQRRHQKEYVHHSEHLRLKTYTPNTLMKGKYK